MALKMPSEAVDGFSMLLRVLILLFFSWAALANGLAQDAVTEYAPDRADADLPAYSLVLDARLTDKGDTIESGMVWRVFNDTPDAEGRLSLVATGKGGTAKFTLPAGTYLVHSAFGRAGGTKRVVLTNSGANESFVLQAGGLQLNAETESIQIPEKDLRFSVFEQEQNEEGERKLIARDVAANRVIRLNAGTYHVLSRYGNINATVRADLQVKAGQVTAATLQHRGAGVSLRLVSQTGGDPVANVAWSVFTEDGEKVFESQSVSPSLILAEGSYEATVRNGDSSFRKSFEIKPGKSITLEILLK